MVREKEEATAKISHQLVDIGGEGSRKKRGEREGWAKKLEATSSSNSIKESLESTHRWWKRCVGTFSKNWTNVGG